MTETWLLAALWLGLALVATLLSIWLRVATALSEIVVGTVAQLIIGATLGTALLHADDSWIKFLSGTGAIVLTFLAGAELDPTVFRRKWKEAGLIGLVGFVAPFFGCTAVAYWVLHWDVRASWLAGVAMSTTSVAVVYAVMLEFGLNVTNYGKTILAACFINDLLTVLALGFIFSPFTWNNGRILRWSERRFCRAAVYHTAVLQALRRATLRARGQASVTYPVRPRRAGDVVGKRGRATGLSGRDGAGRHCGKGSCANSSVAHANLRAAHTVLLH